MSHVDGLPLKAMNLPFTPEDIFKVKEQNFNEVALNLFRFQIGNNSVYREYAKLIGCKVNEVHDIHDIPFLPVELFKKHEVISGGFHPNAQKRFMSSSTSGQGQSSHYFNDPIWHRTSFIEGFKHFYGSPDDYTILALLPGYHENPHSSLITMVKILGAADEHFFLTDHTKLIEVISKSSKPVVVIGVSHALLDFAETNHIEKKGLIVMETGGMKGRRKEITRKELHEQLKPAFGIDSVHSEYGMSELCSQAYCNGEGKFICPQWMKVLIRKYDDPLTITQDHNRGGINIIDLANVESCAFIATSDIGIMMQDNTFEVLGRFDNSEVRGCNVLVH